MVKMLTPPTMNSGTGDNPASTSPPANKVAFVRATQEAVQPFQSRATQITTALQQIGPLDVAAVGYLRSIWLGLVAASGAGAAVTAKADAPWNALTGVSLEDVNGRTIVGPFDGYELYAINKWGALPLSLGLYDPALKRSFSTIAAGTGNFSLAYRLPVELTGWDGLGALPNQTASQTYKLRYSLQASTNVYGTVPTTLPTLTVAPHVEAYLEPDPIDVYGTPQEQEPPVVGTTGYWSKQVFNVSAGDQRIPISRVGNLIRCIIMIFRDGTGARVDTQIPDPWRIERDSQIIYSGQRAYLWDSMHEQYGQTADTGVAVINMMHDGDGRPGNEERNGWMRTYPGTRLEFVGTFAATGTVTILVNDVVPPQRDNLQSGR